MQIAVRLDQVSAEQFEQIDIIYLPPYCPVSGCRLAIRDIEVLINSAYLYGIMKTDVKYS